MASGKPRPLNTHEAAEYLGCSESWLRQLRMRGNKRPGPRYYRLGKAIRYTLEDLDDFKRENSSDQAA